MFNEYMKNLVDAWKDWLVANGDLETEHDFRELLFDYWTTKIQPLENSPYNHINGLTFEFLKKEVFDID